MNMGDVKISVIIPVYNVQDYILDCLLSVSKQTFKGHLECLIVDDCGQDKSIQIAESFIEEYEGKVLFKILKYACNKGAAGARNKAIRVAEGDYIFFLDGDDTLPDNALEDLLKPLLAHPESDFSVGIMKPTRENVGFDWMVTCLDCLPEYISDIVYLKRVILSRFYLSMTACNKLLRKSLFEYPNMMFNESISHEDDHWNFYLAKYTRSACIVKSVTYNYLIREGSKSQAFNQEKSDIDYLRICSDWSMNIDDMCREQQVNLIISLLLPIYFFSSNKGSRAESRNILFSTFKHCTFTRKIMLVILRYVPCAVFHKMRLINVVMKMFE